MTRSKTIRLIPFVCGAGASKPGTERGPVEMKACGLQNDIPNATWQVDPELVYSKEAGIYDDLPPLGSAERRDIVLAHCEDVAKQVEQAVKDGAMPVVLGGDHSVAAGSIAGFAKAKKAHGRVGVIWVDAHGDIHTPATSPSKAYHGMPLAALLGLGDKHFTTIGGKQPVLKPENIVYLGLRSTEPAETRRMSDLGIKAFSMEDFGQGDAFILFARALKAISKEMDYLVLSIDLDAFDPFDAPSVGSPEAGGFHRDDVIKALQRLCAHRMPDMVEIVEFNPSVGDAAKTYALLRDVLLAIVKRP